MSASPDIYNKSRDSLFSTPCPPDLATVLKVLPARELVDQSLSRYFNARLFCVRKFLSTVPLVSY
jgi:hypothetical protein